MGINRLGSSTGEPRLAVGDAQVALIDGFLLVSNSRPRAAQPSTAYLNVIVVDASLT